MTIAESYYLFHSEVGEYLERHLLHDLVLTVVVVARELHLLPVLFSGLLTRSLSAISLVLHGGEREKNHFAALADFDHNSSAV